jgi:MFS family permease
VAVVFLVNGLVFASVVPRYPELKAQLGLSNAAFGSAIGAYGLGALLVGSAAGVLVSRWGSARVAPATAVLVGANLVALGVAPSWLALAAVLFVSGSLDAIADVAANTHGLRVERLYRRSILNSLHGLWSVGAVAGGLLGAAAAGAGLAVALHLSLAAALAVGASLGASRFLLRGRDDAERTGASEEPPRAATRSVVRLAGPVLALGTIAAVAQSIEDAGAAWSPVFLREDLGATAGVAGLAFVALQASQTVGRLLGDRVVTRFGDRLVARAGAGATALAMAGALAAPSPAAVVAAFAVAGLGIATLIPASARTADALPGLAPGVGLTLVSTVDRVAIFAAPPLIGVLADATSLRAALVALPVAATIVVALAPALGAPRVRAPRSRP